MSEKKLTITCPNCKAEVMYLWGWDRCPQCRKNDPETPQKSPQARPPEESE